MKRKASIFALILAVLMCFLTVSIFAAEGNGSSQMPFVDTDEISPEFPAVETEGDLIEEFEEMFGENGKMIAIVSMVGAIFMFLFIPSLIVTIVFCVLNGKIKRKIKEYERFFGPVPQNTPNTYNSGSYNYQQPINTNAPYGAVPMGSYVPQNDVKNQQGGNF